jgi:type IX secretion system PorP/SprF family membrane protein
VGRRISIYIILMVGWMFPANSQLLPLLDQYHMNGLAINPAYAGSHEALSVGLYARNQWVGFEGAPQTFTISMHSPMRNRKVNLGILILADRLGSKRETGFLLNYAYRMDLGGGKLSLGLAAGMTNLSFNLNSIRFTDPGDNLLQDPGRSALLPAFSLGSYYYTDKYYLGLSLPLFTGHRLDQSTGKYRVSFNPASANYLINAGYVFRLSENVELLPSVLVKSNPSAATQLDLMCRAILIKKIALGASIRTGGNLTALLQVQINTQLRFGYSYGYELTGLSSYQNGTHELVLMYNFKYILDVISPRYF